MNIYSSLTNSKSKQLAVLIDPDKYSSKSLAALVSNAQKSGVAYFFVGGSLLTHNHSDVIIKIIKDHCSIPVILFPGDVLQVNENADAILLLSLISGRNADLLIGRQVVAAPFLKKSKLEILPTGYMLIESGKLTTALYISNTVPIPRDKDEIAVSTALAGEQLGLKLIYLDAGSGAENPVTFSMIAAVKSNISVPLIVGGGIRTILQARASLEAGADVIVVGNAIENKNAMLEKFADIVRSF